MEVLQMENINFSYPDQQGLALNNINLTINEGEFVVICGQSGCGKSTMLKHFKAEISPHGYKRGDIYYKGKRYSEFNPIQLAADIGFVFQDPENQIVMDEVYQELFFGMENIGLEHNTMRKRMTELVQFFDLESLLYRKTFEISGGQKQLVNLAAVLLLQPKVLLLDEPTSQLDPIATKEFVGMLNRLNEELGLTIIVVDHRLEELLPLADRVVMMHEGKIKYNGSPKQVLYEAFQHKDHLSESFFPSISKLYFHYENEVQMENIPLTVKEGITWIKKTNPSKLLQDLSIPKNTNGVLLACQHVDFRYRKELPPVLNRLTLSVKKGEFFAILGKNGSGKSTLLKLFGALLTPYNGKVEYKKKQINRHKDITLQREIAYLPQNPKSFFTRDSLMEEMLYHLKCLNIKDDRSIVEDVIEKLRLSSIINQHPYDLSGGELQKAALACLLLSNPEVLLIDEPTKGLDPEAKQQLGRQLQRLNESGTTIIMATHDIEFAAKYCSKCAIIFDGEITVEGRPDEVFKDNFFYTTSVNRITRVIRTSEVVTVEEAYNHWIIEK